jgi:hypothetical protein
MSRVIVVSTNSWLSGISGNWTTAADWSAGAVPLAADPALINAGGTYTVTIDSAVGVGSLTLGAAGATIEDLGTLTLAQGLTLAAGGFDLAGAIIGGVIADPASAMTFNSGTLSGVTYAGTLNLTPGSWLWIANGLTAEGADGTGPGAINLGTNSVIFFLDNQTIDNATITLGPGAYMESFTSYAYYSSSQQIATLTLGPNLTIDQTGAYGSLDGNGSGGNIVNEGTFNAEAANGYFSINPTSFTNAGQINAGSGEALFIDPGSFTNAATGTITVDTGGVLHLGSSGGTWTNAGSIVAQAGAALYLQGSTVYLPGLLSLAGQTLAVGPGISLAELVLQGGTIAGGVIQDAGSGVVFQGGTLSGVIYEGALDLTPQSSSLSIADGLSATGADGTGPGTINLGLNSYLYLDDSQILDNATVTLGSGSSVYQYTTYSYWAANGYHGGTLTLGPNLTIDQTGASGDLGSNGYGGGTIVNDGTFNAGGGSGSNFTVNPTTFINAGQITVGSGESLTIDPGSFTNAAAGTITVDTGGALYLGNNSSTWSNAGSIVVQSGAALYLVGTVTEAQLAGISDSGTVYLQGLLSLGGQTLAVGPGTSLAELVLQGGGTIAGGVIQDAGSGVVFQGGTLSGATYEGALDLTPQSSSLWIANGLSATGADGTGPGTINLGPNSYLYLDDSQTLDNATLTLGSGSSVYQYTTYSYWAANGNQTGTLTLGPNLTIDQIGPYGYLGSTGYGGGTIVNDGTFNAGGGGSFYINPAAFTNAGEINVLAGEDLIVSASSFTNAAGITITGGQLEAQAQLLDNGTISVQGGTLRLDAGFTGGGTISIGPNGTVLLPNGASPAEIETLEATSQGDIAVNGGFDNTNQTLAVTSGTVEFQNALVNTGSITVTGATLLLDNGISGGGRISLGAGGTLISRYNLTEIDGGTLNGVLAGTLVAIGAPLALAGTFAFPAGTTGTVTFESAQFGWYGNGAADLAGPGTLASTGVVSVTDWSGNLQLELSGGITWDSAGTVYDYGWTVLTGGAAWVNTGTIYDRYQIQFGTGAGDSATIVNAAGALFDLNSGSSGFGANGAGTYSFVNDGTLLQDSGGTNRIYLPVVNAGLVESTNGLLELYGAVLGGTFESAGAWVSLLGASSIAAGVTTTVNFESAIFGWSGDGYALLSGPGTLASTGTVYVYDWGSNLQLELAGGLQWDSSGTVYDYGSTQLTGGATWTNTGTIYDRNQIQFGAGNGDSATIINAAGALFDLNGGNSGFGANGAGTYSFVNDGTLSQDSGGTNRLYVPVTNSGLVVSTSGVLELYGAVLGGTFQSNGGWVSLLGTSSIAAGTTATVNFQSAIFGWNGDGFALLSGPGTLASTGTAYVYDWGGNLQLELAGGIQWNSAGTVYDYGWTQLTGGATWSNTGTIYDRYRIQFGTGAGDSATIVNAAGALFDLNSGNSGFDANGAGTYSFVNDGTLLQDQGGADRLYVPVTNNGLVVSTNGLLELWGAVLGGTFEANGGSVALVGASAIAAGATATVDFQSATFGWGGDGLALLSGPGTLASTGTVYVTDWGGNLQLELAGGLQWDSAGTVYDYGLTELTGGATWVNTGTVYDRYRVQFGTYNGDSATIVNAAGALFDLNSGSSGSSIPYSGTYSFINDGTLLQDAGGNDYFTAPLVNAGLVETTNGLLEIANATLGGTFEAAGGQLALVGANNIAAGTTVTVTFESAQFGWYGDGAGVLSGPGTLASTGTVSVTDWGNNVQLELAGGIEWDSAGTVYDYGWTVLTGGATWVNTGAVYDRYRVQFGAFNGDSATIINVAGALFDLNNGSSGTYTPYSGTYSFINNGTLLQNGGGSNYFTAPLVNAGLVETTSGFLEIANATLGGTFEAAGGQLVLVGTYAIAAGTTDTVTFGSAQFGWYYDGAANLTGPGTLASTGTVSVTDWGGNLQLLLTGGITWDSAGTVYDYGWTELTGGATWVNTGTVYDRYRVQFGTYNGDSATFVNAAGALFDLNSGSSGSYAPYSGSYSFINDGTLLQDAGGNNYFTAPLVNTGLVETTNGFLEIANATLGGTFEAAGGQLALVGTYAIAAGTTDTVTFESVRLGYYYDGIATLAGPGTLASSGEATVNDWGGNVQLLLTGGITWTNSGTVHESGTLQFGTGDGDSATIVNQAGAVFDLNSGNSQLTTIGSGTYRFINQGLLDYTGGYTLQLNVAFIDSGTVTAGNGTIQFNNGGTVSGVLNGAGAIVFNGGSDTVTATGTIDSAAFYLDAGTLVLQGGTVSAPTLSFAAGAEVTGFGLIADLTNNGLIDASGGVLTVSGPVTGTGGFQIEAGAILELTGATGQTVTFNGKGATLKLDAPSSFTGTLLGFGAGDAIDLTGVSVLSAAISGGVLTVDLSTGGSLAFAVPTVSGSGQLVTGADGAGGFEIALQPAAATAHPVITTVLGSGNTIVLPDAHVAGTPDDQQTLSIANIATAPADGLNAGIGVVTGSAYGTGTITSLAPGATDATAISAGLDNTTGGAKIGTVTLTYATDGTVSNVASSLPGPVLNLTGNVYRYAAPSITAPSGVILHAGDGGGTATEALTVANTSPADGYSESRSPRPQAP